MAILAGDGLLTEAFALLAREPASDDPEIARAQARHDRRSSPSAAGVDRDGRWPGHRSARGAARTRGRRRSPLDADALREMHARKTGALITRLGARRCDHGRRRRATLRCGRHATAASSAWPFRSWTTCSMSRGRRRSWARPPARTPPRASRPIRPSSASSASKPLAARSRRTRAKQRCRDAGLTGGCSADCRLGRAQDLVTRCNQAAGTGGAVLEP